MKKSVCLFWSDGSSLVVDVLVAVLPGELEVGQQGVVEFQPVEVLESVQLVAQRRLM